MPPANSTWDNPALGTEGRTGPLLSPRLGPEPFDICPGPCSHEDCLAALQVTQAPCASCGEPIGQAQPYYVATATGERAHVICPPRETEA